MVVEILIFLMEKVCVIFRTSESLCVVARWMLEFPQEIHMPPPRSLEERMAQLLDIESNMPGDPGH